MSSESISTRLYSISEEERLPLELGCREEPSRVGLHKLTFSCSRGINYGDKFSGGATINVAQPLHKLLIGFPSEAPQCAEAAKLD